MTLSDSAAVDIGALIQTLTNAAQLIDGFKQGEAPKDWSAWDRETREAITERLRELYALRGAGGT